MVRALIVAAVASSCLPILAFAQQDAAASPGIKVGAKAPDFALKDQTGTQRTRDQLLHRADYLALVFYRSAGW